MCLDEIDEYFVHLYPKHLILVDQQSSMQAMWNLQVGRETYRRIKFYVEGWKV